MSLTARLSYMIATGSYKEAITCQNDARRRRWNLPPLVMQCIHVLLFHIIT